ncbi:hypothetical protein AG1IA_01473 [Rhizoctonia solani AG-1 IA]|uniref:Uncharacterized protein n=1 Tax=Thanatephorus cucumeris (strain AG1-IA) TaxID=983506 RepID=L8X2F5_THACA|nr:hypothetical protein AG1IA_01473 [Rhizoctonia solani AG-1 IA]
MHLSGRSAQRTTRGRWFVIDGVAGQLTSSTRNNLTSQTSATASHCPSGDTAPAVMFVRNLSSISSAFSHSFSSPPSHAPTVLGFCAALLSKPEPRFLKQEDSRASWGMHLRTWLHSSERIE